MSVTAASFLDGIDMDKLKEHFEQAYSTQPKLVELPFPAYDARRYGLPWCARVVSWVEYPRPPKDVVFVGKWDGKSKHGGAIKLVMNNVVLSDAAPGDVLRYGQKNKLTGLNDNVRYGIVLPDTRVQEVTGAEAFNWITAQKMGAFHAEQENVAKTAAKAAAADKAVNDLAAMLKSHAKQLGPALSDEAALGIARTMLRRKDWETIPTKELLEMYSNKDVFQ